jgi:hypothetical protein
MTGMGKDAQPQEVGHNLHHKINQVLNFAKHGVKWATNDKHNLDIACEHFEKG